MNGTCLDRSAPIGKMNRSHPLTFMACERLIDWIRFYDPFMHIYGDIEPRYKPVTETQWRTLSN